MITMFQIVNIMYLGFVELTYILRGMVEEKGVQCLDFPI